MAAPVFSCLLLLIVYMLTGAAVIAETQNWHYNDALYFAFVSLFTIGTGGSRPTEPNLWVCGLYLLFGTTLMSTCGHILYQEVTVVRKSSAKFIAKSNTHRRNQILLAELEAGKAEIS